MFKRILVALKFTPDSRPVLEKGIEIARELGGAGGRVHITMDIMGYLAVPGAGPSTQ
jgi:hypothetical protein